MTEATRVLVVDDERSSRLTTAHQLKQRGFNAVAVDSAYAAVDELQAASFDIVVTDLRMPGFDGIELLKTVRERYGESDVILITAHGTVSTAVEAMRSGAADYLTKPFPFEALEARIDKLVELRAARRELARLRGLVAGASGDLLGRSPVMREVSERLRLFAAHDAPVLIVGETGTGKEVAARMLHRLSGRASGPFVAVGCGTIPHEIAESELFGHERGAFTGAHNRHVGYFEKARRGTLLLDDIDDLPLEMQVKLLRVLQDGRIHRVGGAGELTIDARVVATSKVDLKDAVAQGTFRDDLYYRLRGLEIRLPPLRARGDDVLLLSQRLIETISERSGAEVKQLGVQAVEALRAHSWPGNVRELERALEVALVLAGSSETIECAHLPAELGCGGDEDGQLFSLHLTDAEVVPFQATVRAFEDALVDWAMRRASGQQKEAASLLELPRTTLQSKLRRD